MARGERRKLSLEEWNRKLAAVKIRKQDMNNLIMNYLVTEGFVEAAEVFMAESGTQPGVDLPAITDRMQIRKALQSGNVEDAIDRVNDLNPEILEEGHELDFHLQQQRMIELVRQGKTEEALEFAQEYLGPRGEENPQFQAELERTVALLVFPDARDSPLGDLMELSQRQKVASELNAAILSSQGQEQEPRLPLLLKMLLWAHSQLEDKLIYPHISNLATAELGHQAPDG
ncbi:hypothetical protein WJX73_010094 [Symbiochloris irregularis]|uniref:CTLH domain-containing protein n=1 Tax=Symbiochloris irregularis TaxID=706552 RepID=A0AAW1NS03_9CHLO